MSDNGEDVIAKCEGYLVKATKQEEEKDINKLLMEIMSCPKSPAKNKKTCVPHRYFERLTAEQLEQIMAWEWTYCEWCGSFVDEEPEVIMEEEYKIISRCKRCETRCKGYMNTVPKINTGIKYITITNCTYSIVENNMCTSHQYLHEWAEDELNPIGERKCTICIKCKHYMNKEDEKTGVVTKTNYYKTEKANEHIKLMRCEKCTGKTRVNNAQKRAQKNAGKIKCAWTTQANPKDDRKPCTHWAINETAYCMDHKYVNEYNDVMKAMVTRCTGGCKRLMYLEGNTRCYRCRNRIKPPPKEKGPKCKNEGCSYKAKENGYCGNHQRIWKKNELEKDGKQKVCANYVRGCFAILDINDTQQCRKCLNIANEMEQIRREGKKKEAEEKLALMPDKENYKICSTCITIKPNDQYIGNNEQVTVQCSHCREINKRADEKRGKRNRDYAEELRRNPARAEKIRQRLKANWDIVRTYWQLYRARQIEMVGLEEYRKANAEYKRKWREERPEKMAEINAANKVNIEHKFVTYQREARKKGREYLLTFEESKTFFLSRCYYCGFIPIEGKILNGIDRKSNYLDYTQENCVPCCEVCNMMKGDVLDDIEFIKMAEHILTNLEIIKGNLHPECFKNYGSYNYNVFVNRSIKRGKTNTLLDKEYYDIVDNDCYICGKKNTKRHNNGVDRIFNNVGYLVNNCKACCGTCNFMKREYDILTIIHKMRRIYEKHNNITVKNNNISKLYLKLLKPHEISKKIDIKKIRTNRQHTINRVREDNKKYKKIEVILVEILGELKNEDELTDTKLLAQIKEILEENDNEYDDKKIIKRVAEAKSKTKRDAVKQAFITNQKKKKEDNNKRMLEKYNVDTILKRREGLKKH